jgi:hypothetical protein
MTARVFSKDTREFIRLLARYRVRYLIVGGVAVNYHGLVRYTGDIDIFYEPTKANAGRLYRALKEFWSGKIPGLKRKTELLGKKTVFLFGVPPYRIDILNSISGVSFAEAWKGRVVERISLEGSEVEIFYIGLVELIANKEKIGRFKDGDFSDLTVLAERDILGEKIPIGENG